MRLYIRAKNVQLSEKLREQVHARLAFALARLGHQVRDITVSLTDLNGPKGGVDKQCRLVARLRPNGRVAIEQSSSDFHAAIAQAADRLGYAVSRALKRRRDVRIKRRQMRTASVAAG